MSGNKTYDVIFQYSEQGAENVVAALAKMQDAIDEMYGSSKLNEDQAKALTNTIVESGKAFEQAASSVGSTSTALKEQTGDVKEADSAWDNLAKSVRKAQAELTSAMQDAAGKGSLTPFDDVRGRITPEALGDYNRVKEAQQNPYELENKRIRELEAANKRAADAYTRDWYAAHRDNEARQKKVTDAYARDWSAAHRENESFNKKAADAYVRDWEAALKEVDARATEQGSRGYANASVNHDAVIEKQTQEGLAFSAQLQNRLAEETEKTTQSVNKQVSSLPTLRYALYDVARTAGVISGAITAAGAAMVVTAAQYESSFTAIERTSGAVGDQAKQLQQDFLQLSREIPQTFADLANIGARGAQLGIATEELESFTDTVAKFVATSDTVTLDQAVEAFGRISNLLGDTDFNRLGSSITLVGVNAASTEAQIIKTTQELAPFAAAVGLASYETIGLASAVASLGQPPERARSAFLTLQKTVDRAVSSGGDQLRAFSTLMGQTDEEIKNLWEQDPGVFITSFVQALGATENLTAAFDSLGVNERRAVQVFQALAADAKNAGDGVSVLAQSMSDSERGYFEGSELSRQYALILDDLASKWQLVVNGIKEFVATTGAALAPGLKIALDLMAGFINALTDMAAHPVGQFVVGLASVIASLVAGFTALVAVVAVSAAGMAAMMTVTKQFNLTAGTSILSISGLKQAFTQLSAQVGISTGALRAFRVALASTGIGLLIVGVGALATAMTNMSRSSEEAFRDFVGDVSGLKDAILADSQAFQELAGTSALVNSSFTPLGESTRQNTEALTNNKNTLQEVNTVLGISHEMSHQLAEGVEELTLMVDEQTYAWLNNKLAQSEAFQELVADGGFRKYIEAIGLDMDKFQQIAFNEGHEAANNYRKGLDDAFIEKYDVNQWLEFKPVDYTGELEDIAKGHYEAAESIRAETEAAEILGIVQEDLGEIYEDTIMSTYDFIDSTFEAVNAEAALEQSLYQLGEAFANEGAQAAFSGQQIQAAIRAIADSSGGDASVTAANLQQLFNFLSTQAGVTTADLLNLINTIKALEGVEGFEKVAPSIQMPDFQPFVSGAQDAYQKIEDASRKASGSQRADRAAEKQAEKDAVQELRDAWNEKIEKQEDALAKLKASHEGVLLRLEKQLGVLEEIEKAAQEAFDAGVEALENQKKALEDNVKELQKYADSLITVADYAGTVGAVFDRAFSLRFDFGNSEDAITTMFRNITNGFKDAARSVRDLRTEIKSINASIQEDQAKLSKLEYWRGIASMYGDTARVEQLDAEIAKTRADLTKKTENLTDTTEDLAAAENATSRSLVGNSEQAIINRAAMEGLARGYKDQIIAAIEAGKSEKEVAKLIRDSQKAFEDQATQLGFSKKEAKTYYDSIGDLSTILLSMPKEVKPTISITGLTPANAAITEFLRKFNAAEAVKKAQILVETQQEKIETFKKTSDEAVKLRTAKVNVTDQRDRIASFKKQADAAVKARTAKIAVDRKAANKALSLLQANIRAKAENGKAGTNGGRGGGYPIKITTEVKATGVNRALRAFELIAELADLTQQLTTAKGETRRWLGRSINSLRQKLSSGDYHQGGYTGQGGMYEPAGIVHRGEYVIPKRDVNQATGRPFADALGRHANGTIAPVNYNTVNNNGPSGVTEVRLSPMDHQLIANALHQNIVVNGQVLGRTVSNENVHASAVGSN